MGILLTVLHVIVALFLILVVLLQTGKRADLAGAFGGGGSQTAFGTRGAATVLSKATTAAAVLFMLTSVSLSIVADRRSGRSGTVLEGREIEAAVPDANVTDSAADGATVSVDEAVDGATDATGTDGEAPTPKPVPIRQIDNPFESSSESSSTDDGDQGGSSP